MSLRLGVSNRCSARVQAVSTSEVPSRLQLTGSESLAALTTTQGPLLHAAYNVKNDICGTLYSVSRLQRVAREKYSSAACSMLFRARLSGSISSLTT